ncbi:MAG: radical SAM protein, partial [bacterium]
TLSGGEPLLQPQFAKEILAQCKDRRLHTVLDTCGYCEWRVFESLLRYVDLVLYDVKMIDPQKHRRFTGVSNDVILANVSKLAEMGKKMILRLPIVPAHNDSMEDISQMIAFCQRLCGNGSVVGVDLLPYHKYAQSKYRAFGKPYSLDKLEPPTEEKIEAIKKAFEGKKIKVKVD